MSKLDDLEVGSAEFEAEVARLDDEEEAQKAAGVKVEDEPKEPEADDPPKDAPTDEAQPEPKAEAKEPEAKVEPDKPAPPSGVTGKDGKTVLPYAALQGARAETKAERAGRQAAEARAEAAEKELADLKAGKKPEYSKLTEDELEDLKSFDTKAYNAYVAADKAATESKARIAELEKQAPKPAAESEDDPVQDAIDAIPLLATWQATDKEKFQRAREIDGALLNSPKWKGSTPTAYAKRFTEVTRMVADEFNIKIAQDTPQPNGQSKAKPEDRIDAAERQAPNTLSDLKGGAPEQDLRIDKMDPIDQMNRLNKMSKAEFDAYIAKL